MNRKDTVEKMPFIRHFHVAAGEVSRHRPDNKDFKYVVQAWSSDHGWIDSNRGGVSIPDATRAAHELWNRDESWMRRTKLRVVRAREKGYCIGF